MTVSSAVRERLYARLRQCPSTSSVPCSLPVLFFGDLFTASVATVGLNPSDKEYLDKQGDELKGMDRRFETLMSLNAANRLSLTNDQCDLAIHRMRMYYQPGKPVYGWFRSLDRVARAMGFRYEKGEATHLDLTQEATQPTWSSLSNTSPAEFETLRSSDLPFLEWQLKTFPLRAVICNGRTAFDEICRLLGGHITEKGKLQRITWYVGSAKSDKDSRKIGLAGWNIPLARPTGLGADGEQELGRILASRLAPLLDKLSRTE